MKCSECGEQNPPETRFCARCGHAMPQDAPVEVQGKLKHSEFGIASLVIGILAGAAMLVLIGLAAYLVSQGKSEQDPMMVVAGLGLILDVLLLLLGGILGVVGVFVPNRNKVTAIVGIVCNIMPSLLFLLLFIIGTMKKMH